MKLTLKSIRLENFKGIKELEVSFGEKSTIRGKNASGKTTIVDAFLWLLFNKNSVYSEKFDLRPLDSDGKFVDYVDITVSAVIDIDGKETELKKVQKQNWVKQRGSETAVFKGNVNSFEIDGFPKSEKEYKDFIASLMDENLFKILTNPLYFPSMKWKDQRDMLMKLAITESDIEIAKRVGGYDALYNDLEKGSLSDIQKKYANALKELKAKQAELPVRIDEISKQKVDIDVAELELQRNAIKEQIEKVKASTGDSDRLREEKRSLDLDISLYEQKANTSVREERSKVETELVDAKNTLRGFSIDCTDIESQISGAERMLNTYVTHSAELGSEYAAEREKVFDESKAICPTCGQNLPAEKVDSLKTEFASKKKARMEKLLAEGRDLKVKIDSIKGDIESLKAKYAEVKAKKDAATETVTSISAKLENIPSTVDLSNDNGYNALISRRKEIENKIAECANSAVSENVTALEIELKDIDAKISAANNNANIDDRIEELKAEQRDVSQKVASAEKMLYLAENLVKEKLNSVSASINGQFEFVKWKLFEQAINGGISETCELTVNGVGYAELNSAGKIQAGLDVIRTLSKIYDKYAPIWTDNRESVTKIPEMDAQVISLYVDPNYDKVTVVQED